MDSIQQILTSSPQLASSASTVAGALAKPQAATNAAPAAGTNTTAAAAAANSSTITANDFLTLLVAEMKNQDPTAPTDPNAYITQMVDVNSLQQLIGINSGITSLDTAAGAAPPASAVSSGGAAAAANASNRAIDAMNPGTNGAAVGSSGMPLWTSGTSS